MQAFQAAPHKTKRIAELDGLRAFAVMAVILYHMTGFAHSVEWPHPSVARAVESIGPNGVNVFFVISGFIITTLLIKENRDAGRVSLRSFYIRRVFRILPPFGVYIATIVALKMLGTVFVPWKHIVFSTLFLGNTRAIDGYSLVAHTWSLSVEEQYYLAFPLLFCLVWRFKARPTMVSLTLFYVLCEASLKIGHELALRFGPGFGNIALLSHFRPIVIGVFIALIGRERLGVLVSRSPIGLLVPVLLTLFFALSSQVAAGHRAAMFVVSALEPIACGLLVMWFVENPKWAGFLRWPAVQWLGACSYSLYLWQQLFTGRATDYNGWSVAQSPLSAIPILLCAALSYYCVERPSIRLGHTLSKRFAARIPAEPRGTEAS